MEVLSLFIAFFIGCAATSAIHFLERTSGTLKIDRSDPEKDRYRFEINDDLDSLITKKKIVLKIDNHADLSQK